MHVLGIDIGGSGIKGTLVDTLTGSLLSERYRLSTPESAKPKAIARVVGELSQHFNWQGVIGCGFPAVIVQGVAHTAANIHKSWIDTDVTALFAEATGCKVNVLNDADAAGVAEMAFGAGKGRLGVVLLVTIGTGLGTVLFSNGHLVPNMELGHIEIDCLDAELNASDAARKRENLSWKKWALRFNKYLTSLEKLVWPDLIILGGGIVKEREKFMPYLTLKAEVVPALFGNDAGIVGAALAAAQAFEMTA